MNVVIVLNYNDIRNTEKYVKKIKNYACIDKIIIIDNNSTEDSSIILKELEQNTKIEILFNKENTGYASGNNIALNYAYNKFAIKNFIISNPDIEITESSFELILNTLESSEYVAVSGLVHNSDGTIPDNYAWKFQTYKYLLSNKLPLLKLLLEKMKVNNKYKKIFLTELKTVDVISGCFFAIKAEPFKNVDFFDEKTFLYFEEDILFSKLAKLGYKSCIVTKAPLIHYGGTSTKKSLDSYKKMAKVYFESERVYLLHELKINRVQLLIYDLAMNIGNYERLLKKKIVKDILKK